MTQERPSHVQKLRIVQLLISLVFGMFLSAAVLIANAIAADPAAAQDPIADWATRPAVVEQLAARFNEQPTQIGLTAEGAVLELFAAADGQTWTLVLTLPSGMSRVVAAGQSWMSWPVPKPGLNS